MTAIPPHPYELPDDFDATQYRYGENPPCDYDGCRADAHADLHQKYAVGVSVQVRGVRFIQTEPGVWLEYEVNGSNDRIREALATPVPTPEPVKAELPSVVTIKPCPDCQGALRRDENYVWNHVDPARGRKCAVDHPKKERMVDPGPNAPTATQPLDAETNRQYRFEVIIQSLDRGRPRDIERHGDTILSTLTHRYGPDRVLVRHPGMSSVPSDRPEGFGPDDAFELLRKIANGKVRNPQLEADRFLKGPVS